MDSKQHYVIDFKEPDSREWDTITDGTWAAKEFDTYDEAREFLIQDHKLYQENTDFRIVRVETSFMDVLNTESTIRWFYSIEWRSRAGTWETFYAYEDPSNHEYYWDLAIKDKPGAYWRLRQKFEILKTYTPKVDK